MKFPELRHALRAADPAAVLVPSAIIERVIQRVTGLPRLLWRVPHRHCFLVDRQQLFRHVEQDELDLETERLLPPQVILLALPPAEELSTADRDPVLLKYWRWLFHAAVHRELERRISEGALDESEIRRRVEAIGPAAFEEVRAVLDEDHLLLPPGDDRGVYVEFVATYLELRYFAPTLLPVYFPGLSSRVVIEALIAEDIEADAVFARTRPAGAPDPVAQPEETSDESHDYYWKLAGQARKAGQIGNTVRAAILHTRAARVAPAALTQVARDEANRDLRRLVDRLRVALHLQPAEAEEWMKDLHPLLDKADQGNRPVEAALLFDLQKACDDHERDLYTLDLVEWVLSGGQRPIKRPLPSQRVVRITRHLRNATRRLTTARLTDAERQHLNGLLTAALHGCEGRLRQRFRPVLADALLDAGLEPRTPPERAAFDKMVEELLDRISEQGFFNFGDLRDVISRNQLKVPDLSGPQEYIRGDPLLRLDRRLATLLDGVYRRADFYIRLLQRVTALNFGTRFGRALTWNVWLPFGGALLLTEGLELILGHLYHVPNPSSAVELPVPDAVASGGGFFQRISARMGENRVMPLGLWLLLFLGMGAFFLGLVRSADFRRNTKTAIREGYRAARFAFVELPVSIFHSPLMRALIGSWAFQLILGFLLKPLVIVGLLWLLLPTQWAPGGMDTPLRQSLFDNWPGRIGTFLVANLLMNSRLGLALEHAAFQAAALVVQVVGTILLPSVWSRIVWAFKQLLGLVEQVTFAVEEWLRFRGGDSVWSMVVRTILGVLWFPVAYLIRFYIIVLIEPGINPVKFPISSVAAKFVYPVALDLHFQTVMADLLSPMLGSILAGLFAFATWWLLPDAVGFLFWETKENWSLYRANRRPALSPVPVGTHGETVAGLLLPGFHSGTVPWLFRRLRHAEDQVTRGGDWRAMRTYRQQLTELEGAVRRFVERELVALLDQRPEWRGQLRVGEVRLATNGIAVGFEHVGQIGQPAVIAVTQRCGWLVARLADAGWLANATPSEAGAFARALAGLYKLMGVDLVDEQIWAALPPGATGYDVVPTGLRLRLNGDGGRTYDLSRTRGELRPLGGDGPVLNAEQVAFRNTRLSWEEWEAVWCSTTEKPTLLGPTGELILVRPADGPRGLLPPASRESGT